MKRTLLVLASALLAFFFGATTAQAATPTRITQSGGVHFVGTPIVNAVQLSNGNWVLQGTGEVAGAGKSATATLSADVDLVTGCINRGSKDQQPSGLQRTTSTTTGSVEFRTRSGRGTFTVTTTPSFGTAGRTCPDHMASVLVSLTFSNVTLTVTSQTGTTTAFYGTIRAV